MNYSQTAIKQAEKDGKDYLFALKQANVLETRRRVKICGYCGKGNRTVPPGGKLLHLIRHGQGFHNLLGELYADFGIDFNATGTDLRPQNPYRRSEVLDPPLTELGREQAKQLRSSTQALSPELIVVSPLCRATQTAVIAFSHLLKPGSTVTAVPFLAHEAVREQAGAHYCDACRGLGDMRIEFPMVDYSFINNISMEKDEDWSDSREQLSSVAERGYDFLLWLRSRPEQEVAIATHSAFLFVLLNAVVDTGQLAEGLSSWFLTGEMRSVIITFEAETQE
uniref:Phosphoglycerate mutase-like protein n=1 Tax=Tetraselmis sp. GSL018 TaxID=582737 RepID=A0A061R0P8_9CHLO